MIFNDWPSLELLLKVYPAIANDLLLQAVHNQNHTAVQKLIEFGINLEAVGSQALFIANQYTTRFH